MNLWHAFTSTRAQGPDATLVRKRDWNHAHTGDYIAPMEGAGHITISGSSPDLPPASPSAYDDEFDTLSGWTTMSSPETCNVTDRVSHLHLRKRTTGWMVAGVYKACPSMPFTVTAKFSDVAWQMNWQSCGLMLTEASPGKLLAFGNVYANGNNNSGYGIWTNPTSRASYTDSYYTIWPCKYVRLVVTSSSSVAMEYSQEGLFWYTVRSGIDTTFTVGGVGIYLSGQDTPEDTEGFIDWIRFT